MHAQFGRGLARLDHFRWYFAQNVQLAMAVYPEARVDIDGRGLTLNPSRPPVAPKIVSIRVKRLKTLGVLPSRSQESPGCLRSPVPSTVTTVLMRPKAKPLREFIQHGEIGTGHHVGNASRGCITGDGSSVTRQNTLG